MSQTIEEVPIAEAEEQVLAQDTLNCLLHNWINIAMDGYQSMTSIASNGK
ncbi:hypothetical protein OURE66S_01461 [Oligella ureolytica]